MYEADDSVVCKGGPRDIANFLRIASLFSGRAKPDFRSLLEFRFDTFNYYTWRPRSTGESQRFVTLENHCWRSGQPSCTLCHLRLYIVERTNAESNSRSAPLMVSTAERLIPVDHHC
ncbi:uncharacterized protein LOC135377295 isoform X3 [Ornithodoros turicata]|uniref:uncharacterized protein LOC135377295 isoform X3 n=1 Tax=Ornithodoros turicata TaxID=34597 RepID=UPI003138D532